MCDIHCSFIERLQKVAKVTCQPKHAALFKNMQGWAKSEMVRRCCSAFFRATLITRIWVDIFSNLAKHLGLWLCCQTIVWPASKMVTSCQSWLEHNVTPQSFQLDGSEWVTRYYKVITIQDIDTFTRWGNSVRYFQILYTSIDKILQGTTRYDKTLQDIAIKMLQATTK